MSTWWNFLQKIHVRWTSARINIHQHTDSKRSCVLHHIGCHVNCEMYILVMIETLASQSVLWKWSDLFTPRPTVRQTLCYCDGCLSCVVGWHCRRLEATKVQSRLRWCSWSRAKCSPVDFRAWVNASMHSGTRSQSLSFFVSVSASSPVACFRRMLVPKQLESQTEFPGTRLSPDLSVFCYMRGRSVDRLCRSISQHDSSVRCCFVYIT